MQDYHAPMKPVELTRNPARTLGARIRAARGAAKLTQDQLADMLSFADRQTLSAIETGERRVQAAELVNLSQALQRPVDWFIDPFVVAGEASFSWRVSPTLGSEALDDFESYVGQIVGLYRHLKISLNGPIGALTNVLRARPDASFEEAWEWGESVAETLDLGSIPALCLAERIESKLDLPVMFVDTEIGSGADGISGAMCRLPDISIIVINRRESQVRRHFDVAHELFHALTWDALTPERRENLDAKPPRRYARVEQLADNFAAALLMPRASLTKLIDPARFDDAQHLAEVARDLQVSTRALAFRLLNARMIDKRTCAALQEVRFPKVPSPEPKLFSQSFVSLLHDGIARGHVSARKAAKALSMTLEALDSLMRDYNKTAPFSM
jgi:Zn-dependent peptidase ImmA (M78 family)/transcriptional regulator with XRE-family HTH domain